MTGCDKKVSGGKVYKFHIGKNGYWNQYIAGSSLKDKSYGNIELVPYSGVQIDTTNNAFTAKGLKPDGKYLEEIKGYLGPVGTKYLINNQILEGILPNDSGREAHWTIYEDYFNQEDGLVNAEGVIKLAINPNLWSMNNSFTGLRKIVHRWLGEFDVPERNMSTLPKINFSNTILPTFTEDRYAAFSTNGTGLFADNVLPTTGDGYLVQQKYRLIARIKTASLGSSGNYKFTEIYNEDTDLWISLGVYQRKFEVDSTQPYSPSSTSTINSNTFYWVCFEVSDTSYAFRYMIDSGTYLTYKDLPELTDSEWTVMYGSCHSIGEGKISMGTAKWGGYPWNGQIDLENYVIQAYENATWVDHWLPLRSLR